MKAMSTLPTIAQVRDAHRFQVIEIAKIIVTKVGKIEKSDLERTVASIKSHTLLQPVGVVPSNDDPTLFLLIFGHTRLEACRVCGEIEVPAQVFEKGVDIEALRFVENHDRQTLHPLDEAIALRRIKVSSGETHEQLAQRFHMAVSTVTAVLQLAELRQDVQEQIRALKKRPSREQLIELSRVKDPDQQRELVERMHGGKVGRNAIRAMRKSGEFIKAVGPDNDLGGCMRKLSAVQKALNVMRLALPHTSAVELLELRAMLSEIGEIVDRLVEENVGMPT